MSSLPNKPKTSEGKTTEFFDKYFTKKINFSYKRVGAGIRFFFKTGFGPSSSQKTRTCLFGQTKKGYIKVFYPFDTLKGFK